MKDSEYLPQFEALLRGLFARVPFLKLASLKSNLPISPRSSDRADWVAQVVTGDRKFVWIVESLPVGYPKEVRSAVLKLEHCLLKLPPDPTHYGVVIAPFLSAESARICTEAGMGYADLAGNVRLSFGQVFIEMQGTKNPFREKRANRSLFAPRAARVLRVLLQGPLRPWKVTELAAASQVSLGWVSAVRQQLQGHEWATEGAGGLRVTKPGSILDAWAKADDWKKRTVSQEYSVLLSDPLELATKLKQVLPESSPAFTQWFAAGLRHPYTATPVVSAYVRQFPDDALIREKLLGRRVSTGGGALRLIMAKDEGVFNPAQTVNDFQLVSDVQIYLDLLCAGLRGGEQAQELRQWPDFAGGWE